MDGYGDLPWGSLDRRKEKDTVDGLAVAEETQVLVVKGSDSCPSHGAWTKVRGVTVIDGLLLAMDGREPWSMMEEMGNRAVMGLSEWEEGGGQGNFFGEISGWEVEWRVVGLVSRGCLIELTAKGDEDEGAAGSGEGSQVEEVGAS